MTFHRILLAFISQIRRLGWCNSVSIFYSWSHGGGCCI